MIYNVESCPEKGNPTKKNLVTSHFNTEWDLVFLWSEEDSKTGLTKKEFLNDINTQRGQKECLYNEYNTNYIIFVRYIQGIYPGYIGIGKPQKNDRAINAPPPHRS